MKPRAPRLFARLLRTLARGSDLLAFAVLGPLASRLDAFADHLSPPRVTTFRERPRPDLTYAKSG